jgi:NAD(P)-dependent dehydrogenase (short-subunit alcohol dehydrogenase family)
MGSLMQDRNVIVTGGSDGIGLATARQLAALGARIWIVGRNEEKTKKAVTDIVAETSNEKVGYFIADLSVIASIWKLAESITGSIDHLDILVNNAGAVFTSKQLSADGLEMTFALNHLNYFLLTDLLLGLIKNGRNPRIINVSSSAHYSGHLDFSDLQMVDRYNSMRVYSNSKLMNVLFTYEWVKRMNGSGVTANVLHPGFVASNFGKSNGGIMKPLFRMIHLAAINVDEGAKTSVYLASSPEVDGVTGRYFEKSRDVKSSRESYDEIVADKLWNETEKLIELHS